MGRLLGWVPAAVLSVAGLAACDGGSKASGPVGTWVLDLDRSVKPMVALQMEEAKARFAEMPADRRAMAEKLMPSVEKVTEVLKEQFKTVNFVFDLKSDHSAAMSITKDGRERAGTGTWAQKGNDITITPVSDGGRPIEREKQPLELVLEGHAMRFAPPGSPMTFYLKRK